MADKITKYINREKKKPTFRPIFFTNDYKKDLTKDVLLLLPKIEKIKFFNKTKEFILGIKRHGFSFVTYETKKDNIKEITDKIMLRLNNRYNEFERIKTGRFKEKTRCIRCGKVFDRSLFNHQEICNSCYKKMKYYEKTRSLNIDKNSF